MSQSVGKASYDLLQKPPEKINVIDMQREMQKSVLKELDDIIEKHQSYEKKYYIVYMLQRERTIPNAIRQRFIIRKTRPRPDYDCSLFSYDNQTCQLAFHWSIPDEGTCEYFLSNKEKLSADQKLLLTYVVKFSEGTLV
ncbi:hypothetical protein LCGC14_0803950 [marine sediment metagenome]|uniref:Uncharacterized protein n=1 Tax=marine sediment metagenome TaxID=412755 RepID=A0A0F9SW35_9ZZZZ